MYIYAVEAVEGTSRLPACTRTSYIVRTSSTLQGTLYLVLCITVALALALALELLSGCTCRLPV